MSTIPLFKKRVHIVPVGFDIDRVVMPLIERRADKVWLVLKKDVKENIEKPYIDKIKAELDNAKIVYYIERSTLVDLFDVLNVYRKIIEQERGNEIFINVSTGSKIQSIAGMMACMMFKIGEQNIIPYYVEPEQYLVQPGDGQQMTSGCKEILILPNYRIDRPPQKLIKALSIINNSTSEGKNGMISKKNLIDQCKFEGLINVKKATSRSPRAAEHSQLNKNIIDPLVAWGLVKRVGKGITGRIAITEDGINMLRFLPE